MIAGALFPNGKERIYIARQSIFDSSPENVWAVSICNIRRNIEAATDWFFNSRAHERKIHTDVRHVYESFRRVSTPRANRDVLIENLSPMGI